MSQEKRRFARFQTELHGFLYLCKGDSLCKGDNGDKLTPPVRCQIFDLSKYGARIITSQVIVDQHHLFFSTLESDEFTLFLEVEAAETSDDEKTEKEQLNQLIFPVRPIWFDRVLDQVQKPFKIGFEFNEKLSDEMVRLIKKQSH
ncbi:MAG: hypothetical protein KQH63_13040 [Desulfobulbaceae bacterium]|nr:hypothetical protein [Desulfobulbaceae bacterium]